LEIKLNSPLEVLPNEQWLIGERIELASYHPNFI
jgi:hypothetical protein